MLSFLQTSVIFHYKIESYSTWLFTPEQQSPRFLFLLGKSQPAPASATHDCISPNDQWAMTIALAIPKVARHDSPLVTHDPRVSRVPPSATPVVSPCPASHESPITAVTHQKNTAPLLLPPHPHSHRRWCKTDLTGRAAGLT